MLICCIRSKLEIAVAKGDIVKKQMSSVERLNKFNINDVKCIIRIRRYERKQYVYEMSQDNGRQELPLWLKKPVCNHIAT